MDGTMMRIGEIAAFFNVSVKAMRVYEKAGILKPVKVDEQTGYRYYSADQVQSLNALLELKSLGFSLVEIKRLLQGGMTNAVFMEALVHKKTAWQDRISDAGHKIDAIDRITRRLRDSKPATKMHELTEDERARLLGQMVCVENTRAESELSEALWL
ncbi:MAG: MerR family transcriptional regulator [Defluviitaleaceae bacterium]|nr:MerR family transcriptional regulator [Defluviitaleaceae bacterium]